MEQINTCDRLMCSRKWFPPPAYHLPLLQRQGCKFQRLCVQHRGRCAGCAHLCGRRPKSPHFQKAAPLHEGEQALCMIKRGLLWILILIPILILILWTDTDTLCTVSDTSIYYVGSQVSLMHVPSAHVDLQRVSFTRNHMQLT